MIFDWLASNTAQVLFIFVLLFSLIFGILQKSKLFGEGKRQIDALIALSTALLTTSVAYALDIISKLVPFMAVGLVIVLVFILLFALFIKGGKEFSPEGWMMNVAIGIAFVAVVIAVLYFTGAWDHIKELWNSESSGIIGNVVTFAVVIGVILLVFFGSQGGSSGKHD